MNVLIIGSGGREHAITWKVVQSPRADKVFVLPGNPGTVQIAENVEGISVDDHAAVINFCKTNQIDLVIVGPEAPLANGLVDALSTAGIRCFGPKQAAAEIEASKVFAKDFMARYYIPTARYAVFSDFEEAVDYLHKVDYPIVIKASGLAAGKGSVAATAPSAPSITNPPLTSATRCGGTHSTMAFNPVIRATETPSPMSVRPSMSIQTL